MPLDPFDAPNFIDFGATEIDTAESNLADELLADELRADEPDDTAEQRPSPTVEARFGQAVLRLRLYHGWSQRDLQRTCGVHQSQISRLEAGHQRGMSIKRVFAILRALNVDEIAFLPRQPAAPPTALELMLWGDPWDRAGRAAAERVNRRRSA